MDVFDRAERLMGMDDRVWARHASNWSVFTRIPILPALSLAIWARVWIGGWVTILLLGLLAWVWMNPRVFPAPSHTDTWAAKGTFGERVFLNRKTIPIPDHHLRWGLGLSFASATGLPFLVWGLWALDPMATILGNVLVVLPKIWFVDRMGWLYTDMKDASPEYQSWHRPKP